MIQKFMFKDLRSFRVQPSIIMKSGGIAVFKEFVIQDSGLAIVEKDAV